MALSATQKKQFLNDWLDQKAIAHTLTAQSTLAEFEDLAEANGWNTVYTAPVVNNNNGGNLGSDPTFKMRFAGIIATKRGDRYDYVIENADDLDAFKNAKDSDAASRTYTNNAGVGHHWAYEFEGERATFKFSTAVKRLVVEKKLSAAVALNANKLTIDQLDNLSPNAMRILELQLKLSAANARLVAAE